ncbi:MAG: VTT domain-containing protein [Clostridia bacterium]|nr:VTT domain-containing protein [Clostridia bacterium]
MKRCTADRTRHTLACIFFMIVLLLAIGVIASEHGLSPDALMNYMPQNRWVAALVLWCLFALKSLFVVFPVVVLFTLSGVLFSLPLALLINSVGICITVTLPYLIGKRHGRVLIDALSEKYPKIADLQQMQRHHDFFFVYLSRAVGFFPCDVVSSYMGASGISCWPYLGGCLAGFSLNLLASTVLGTSAEDPTSPTFLISLIVRILMVAVSGYVYWFHIKKGKGRFSGQKQENIEERDLAGSILATQPAPNIEGGNIK